jgi:hypothetical protein
VFTVGDCEKFAPEAEFPKSVLGAATVYQLTVPLAQVADKFRAVPVQTLVALLGVTPVGGATTKLVVVVFELTVVKFEPEILA